MARLLARLGRFSARHRLLVFISWGLVLGILATLALVGMNKPTPKDYDANDQFNLPGTQSSKALDVVDDKFPAQPKTPKDEGTLQLVIKDKAGVVGGTGREAVTAAMRELRTIDHVKAIADPYDPKSPYVSADKSTAVVEVTLRGLTDDNKQHVQDQVTDVAKDLRSDDVRVEVGGALVEEAPELFGPSEIIGVVIAFVVLFLTFGSLIAAGANMIGALTGVAVGIIGVISFTVIRPIGDITPILAVMLGLAVGIDYCLFILARFRSELMLGRTVEDAIARSVGTAGSAVAFAGATVVIALAGLSVVNISFLTEMGLAGAFAVVVDVMMALTFLPALMRGLGHRALSKRQRADLQSEATETTSAHSSTPTFLERWAAFVTKRKAVSITAVVALLGVAAIPALSLQTAIDAPGGDNPKSSERAAYNLILKEFGGRQSPLVVLVQGHNVSDKLGAVTKELNALRDVQQVVPVGASDDGRAGLIQVIPKSGPIDEDTRQLVRDIRDDKIAGVRLSVTGETAIGIDTADTLQRALVTYLGLIVVLSFILLTMLFRSLLVPLMAALGYLLSFAASLGANVAIFQWGWLDWLLPAPQGDPLLSYLPIILAGILFGLAMDYQVFLVSRMHEAHKRGLDPREAVIEGFSRSAPVVVAAASIMIAVFAGFAFAGLAVVASIAFGLAIGVIADAFLVRMVLMPALLTAFGEAAWWMPRWLDRFLPNIDAEGAALEADDAPTRPEPVRV